MLENMWVIGSYLFAAFWILVFIFGLIFAFLTWDWGEALFIVFIIVLLALMSI